MTQRSTPLISFLLLVVLNLNSCAPGNRVSDNKTADLIREEVSTTWRSYMTYAKGYDMLLPLSKSGKNWYGNSLLMTPVDAFDTMKMLGLDEDADEAKKLILKNLSFDHDMTVQVFEVTIRILGGLISAYQIDGDPGFLDLARDLADRLMPAFNSPTGLPYWGVNLRTGAVQGTVTNPAEAGTLMLEFGMMSRLTNNAAYYDKAKNAVQAVYSRLPETGLPGSAIDVESGEWTDSTSHIGGRIDSYFEYLLKAWLLFDDPDFKNMWEQSLTSINRYLADTVNGMLWYGQANMMTGERTATHYGALEAFFAGTLALAGQTELAAKLQESNYAMWQLKGIEPEQLDYSTMKVISPAYYLRPENIESAWYLWHITRDRKWRNMGYTYLGSLQKWCRVEAGYVFLQDVEEKIRGYSMESFFLAETMKYLYLLFADDRDIDLSTTIFNTEAHPFVKIAPGNQVQP